MYKLEQLKRCKDAGGGGSDLMVNATSSAKADVKNGRKEAGTASESTITIAIAN